ncbi:MAG: hypothetical protein ACE5IR_10360 [bacterium]
MFIVVAAYASPIQSQESLSQIDLLIQFSGVVCNVFAVVTVLAFYCRMFSLQLISAMSVVEVFLAIGPKYKFEFLAVMFAVALETGVIIFNDCKEMVAPFVLETLFDFKMACQTLF